MTWERFSLDSYLNRELRFWKSLKAVYVNRGGKNKVLQEMRQRFKEKDLIALAEKRFNSTAAIVRLFKPKYRELITQRVNKEIGAKLRDALDLEEIKRWQGTAPPGTAALSPNS
jgi:hypothetical protein